MRDIKSTYYIPCMYLQYICTSIHENLQYVCTAVQNIYTHTVYYELVVSEAAHLGKRYNQLVSWLAGS